MSTFTKLFGLAFLFLSFTLANCFAVTGTVSVSVSPGHQTVKTREAGVSEEIGINTAEYTITTSCDPQVETGEEVKPVEPSWTITYETEFLPPKDVDPVPEDPGTLSVSISGDDGDWTAKVHSSAAGEWKITFTAEVTYKLWDTTTDNYARNDKGNILTVPFSGTGTCTFKAAESICVFYLGGEDGYLAEKEEAYTIHSYGDGMLNILATLANARTGHFAWKIYVSDLTQLPGDDPATKYEGSNGVKVGHGYNAPAQVFTINAMLTDFIKTGNEEHLNWPGKFRCPDSFYIKEVYSFECTPVQAAAVLDFIIACESLNVYNMKTLSCTDKALEAMGLAGGPDVKCEHEITFTKMIDGERKKRTTTAKLPELLFKALEALATGEE